MTGDTREYVSACFICARGKTSHRPPSGVLCPLPIPHRPWSHIAVDFVTGLPPSEDNLILTIVDQFSTLFHFVSLPWLPMVFEAASLLAVLVFRLHGIPTDIVSDRGPQFTSQVWRALSKAVGVTAHVSFGYHPQSIGQTEQVNQDLESALHCVTSHHPVSWFFHLPWIEYAHNSLVSAGAGTLLFMASNGFQAPLLPRQKSAVSVQSIQEHLRQAHQV